MFDDLTRIRRGYKSKRCSSWDPTGRNHDYWVVEPGKSVVMADIDGPGKITHLWSAQGNLLREVLIRMTWDDAKTPSVLVPVGDFFCLGHCLVNNFQSALFSASTNQPYKFRGNAACNSFVPMPFRKRAKIELINQGSRPHPFWFYVDYETCPEIPADVGYFHAEFRRENPFGGWGPEVGVNTREANAANTGRAAWDNNYVILETKGCGQYIGCNLSVTNFSGSWWGEGDDMIWVDGYKWPPDLHGTGSEDYLSHAWGMQDVRFWRQGSSIWEHDPRMAGERRGNAGKIGYQTSYVFHLENPVRFEKELRASIEVGHANQLANEVSSVAYWYAAKPTRVKSPPPVAKRLPLLRESVDDPKAECPGEPIRPNPEMGRLKKQWARKQAK